MIHSKTISSALVQHLTATQVRAVACGILEVLVNGQVSLRVEVAQHHTWLDYWCGNPSGCARCDEHMNTMVDALTAQLVLQRLEAG